MEGIGGQALSVVLGEVTLEITDATIEGHIDLHRFPMLEELLLYRTGISEEHVTEMRRNFPRIRIEYQARSHRESLRP